MNHLNKKYIIVVKLIVVIDKIILKILTYLVHDTQQDPGRNLGSTLHSCHMILLSFFPLVLYLFIVKNSRIYLMFTSVGTLSALLQCCSQVYLLIISPSLPACLPYIPKQSQCQLPTVYLLDFGYKCL